jgi:hypothetical protein
MRQVAFPTRNALTAGSIGHLASPKGRLCGRDLQLSPLYQPALSALIPKEGSK